VSRPAIRVAIVEDQVLMLDLLATALRRQPELEVVFTASTVAQAREQFEKFEVDVAVLDIDLPDGNGVGLGVALSREFPRPAIVLLSANDMLELFHALPGEVRATWSYLSKTSTTDISVLVRAIVATAQGQSVVDPALVDRSTPRPGSRVSTLTPRQFDVLRCLARGLSNQAIADDLNVGLNSVVNHLTAIYATLGIPDEANPRVHAVLEFLNDTTRDG
jgi:DNA-binding NarL/FixJ family response regulator